MSFKTFKEALKPYNRLNNHLIVIGMKIHHTIVCNSIFEQFVETTNKLNSNIFSECIYITSNDHVHFLIRSREQFNVIVNRRIQIELIKNILRLNNILDIIMSHKEIHDRFCYVTFDFPSLKTICMKTILSSMTYSGNIDQLDLPKRLVDDLFQQNKMHYDLSEGPEWNGEVIVNMSCDLRELDCAQDKDFAACFNSSRPAMTTNYDWSFLIINYFRINSGQICCVCLKCMKFEMKNEKDSLYQRMFEISAVGKMVWCWICKTVPLFQTLSRDEIFEKYGVEIVTSKKMPMSPRCSTIIKVETFINGVKVRDRLKEKKLYVSERFILSPYL